MSTIIGIDPGMSCGFAVRYETYDEIPFEVSWESGAWKLRERPEDGPGLIFLRLRDHLVRLIERVRPDLVAAEMSGGFMPSRAAQFNNYAMCAIVMLVCEQRGVRCVTYSPASVKKVATGHGNSDKVAMGIAAAARWPDRRFQTSDEADARFIAETAAHPPEVKRKPKKSRRSIEGGVS